MNITHVMHALHDAVQAEFEDTLDTETEEWLNNSRDELLVEARHALEAARTTQHPETLREACVGAICALTKLLTVYGEL